MKIKLFLLITMLSALATLVACQPIQPVVQDTSNEIITGRTEPEMVYAPTFEPVKCWWTLPPSQPVECGYLLVPENRSDPASPTIRVATAMLRHPGGNPEPDPIVYIHGGPGGGFMRVFDLEYETLTNFFETNRDVIYFDQRGNGLSEPSLDCPEFAAGLADLFDYTLDGKQVTNGKAQEYLLDILVQCGERLGQTLDLAAYDSPNTAADVNDLRIALGYDQINVYAESYGPRVAQSLMRDYPDGVRSVVLDAAMATYSPLDYLVEQSGGMLSHLFDLCAADEACNSAFPDLRTVWLDTLAAADATPINVKATYPLTGEEFDFVVDDGMLATALFFLSYNHSALPVIPACIYAIHEGDYACLQGALGRVTIRAFVATWGDWINVSCRQQAPISRSEDFAAALETYPEIKTFWQENLFLPQRNLFDPALCGAWGGGAAPESELAPVVSSIPTLLVLGDTDPASMIEESMAIAEPLENHFGPYLYPFLSHVVYGSHACPISMVNAFLLDPATEPEATCINEMGVDFAIPGEGGEVALEPFTNADMGYTGLIPAGWNELATGIYARSDPAMDPTILAQLAVPAAAADAVLGDLLANLGVEALPSTPVRVMDSDSLSWSLHLVTGNPTTAIALAEGESTTYIVALRTAGDEFDVLADGLLVPALMAFAPAN